MAGSIAYLVLSLFGALFLFRANPRTLALTVFPWLHMLVFSIANPLLFRWYAVPAMPILFLMIVAGAWGLASRILGTKRAHWVMAAAGLLWVFTSLRAWTLDPDHGPHRPAPEMAWYKLELLYEEAATDLTPLMREDTVIAAADIGAIGWYSSARILDTLGLVSPQSSRYYPIDPSMLATTGYAVPPDLILDELPDFVVILETYGRNGLLRDERFLAAYRLWRTLETDIYESRGMLIFERKPAEQASKGPPLHPAWRCQPSPLGGTPSRGGGPPSTISHFPFPVVKWMMIGREFRDACKPGL
jgi:hypothetical protein